VAILQRDYNRLKQHLMFVGNILYESLFNYFELLGIASWLSVGLTFVAVFLRFSRASWFALSAAQNIVDPSGSVPSDPKPNA
jgi:hypothetical protein